MKKERVYLDELNPNSKGYKVKVKVIEKNRAKESPQEKITCQSLMLEGDKDFMDKKNRELNEELESANKKCEAYRGHLLSALKDIEDHEKQLATKVHSIKLSLKDATA